MKTGQRARKRTGFTSQIFLAALVVVFAMQLNILSPAALAQLPEPLGEVVLTISGQVERQNGIGVARFDRAMLEKIGLHSFSSRTVYDPEYYRWRGVLVRDLLTHLGAKGDTVELMALDGYHISIPIDEFSKFDIILAMEQNGQALTVRTRGPLRIIYPLDDIPEMSREQLAPNYIWQIEKIIVK